MKRLIVTLCAGAFVFFAMSTAIAQDAKKTQEVKAVTKETKPEVKQGQAPKMPTLEERADNDVKRMSDKIKDLSPDQKTKLKALFLNNSKSAESDRETYKNDMDKMKESAKARYKKQFEDLKSILSKEQWEAYTKPMAPPPAKGDAPKPEPKKEAPKK